MANIFPQPCDEGVILARETIVPCARVSERWILAATILGSSMAFINGTVVNVALPALQKNLNATVLDVQWVVESYALFLAALLVAGGSAGAAWLPFILILFLLSRWSGGLVKSYGAKVPLVVGPAIVALAYGLFMIPSVGGSYWTAFFPAMVVLGVAMAVSVAPLTTTVMNAVPEKRAGVASGVNNAVSRIAGLLGIALLGIVVVHSLNRELDRSLAPMELSHEVRRDIDAQRVKLAGAELSSIADERLRLTVKRAIDESFVFGFRLVMLTSLGLALASAFVALMMIENK